MKAKNSVVIGQKQIAEPGKPGDPGKNGYVYRPRGLFASGNSYVWNDDYRDICLMIFNKTIYTFRVRTEGSIVTIPPSSSSGDVNWEAANELKFVATDVLIALFGMIGSAVFYDEYMISQEGVDKDGNPSTDYKGFEDGTFIPNISLNFLTGEVNFGIGTFRGSIATVPVHITRENISKYINVSTVNGMTFWNIMIDKSGFNIQIDCDNTSADGVINIELPRALKYEGVELNIILAYNTRLQPVVNGIATFESNIVRVDVGLNRFITYQFKCIVFDPPANYSYSLVNGKAVEWIQVM